MFCARCARDVCVHILENVPNRLPFSQLHALSESSLRTAIARSPHPGDFTQTHSSSIQWYSKEYRCSVPHL